MHGVADQPLQRLGQGPRDIGRHGEVLVLLLAQPAQAVAVEQARARTVRAVGAARMIGGAEDVDGRAPRHLCRHRFRQSRLALVVPAVAAGDHQRRPVPGREVGERPDDRDHALPLARVGKGIDQIVPVQLLHGLARPDGDGGGRGELVAGAIGAEHRVVERRDGGLEGEAARGRRVDQHRVRAPGLVAHELARAGGCVGDVPCEVGGDGVHGRRVREPLQDYASVPRQHLQDVVRRRPARERDEGGHLWPLKLRGASCHPLRATRCSSLSGGDGYSAARIAFQVSTYLPIRGGSFQKSRPSA